MRRKRPHPSPDLVEVNTVLRRMIDKLEQANQDLELRIARLERGTEHLADKVSKCITAVASVGEKRFVPVPARSNEPAPASSTEPKPAKKAAKHNEVWSQDDIALVFLMKEKGATYAQIGAVVNRSGGAVQQLLVRYRRGENIGGPRHPKTGGSK
jgi:hypothetical protein